MGFNKPTFILDIIDGGLFIAPSCSTSINATHCARVAATPYAAKLKRIKLHTHMHNNVHTHTHTPKETKAQPKRFTAAAQCKSFSTWFVPAAASPAPAPARVAFAHVVRRLFKMQVTLVCVFVCVEVLAAMLASEPRSFPLQPLAAGFNSGSSPALAPPAAPAPSHAMGLGFAAAAAAAAIAACKFLK